MATTRRRKRRKDWHAIFMRSMAWMCGAALAFCWTAGMICSIKEIYHF